MSKSSCLLDVETSFKRFVLRVLTQRGGEYIQKLSYSYIAYDARHFLTKALAYAPIHRAKKLCINTYCANDLLWSSLSACKFLTILQISCRVSSHLESLVLPSLRMLALGNGVGDFSSYCYYSDYDCKDMPLNESTFSGCPNLECLILFRLRKSAHVFAPKLKNLELDNDTLSFSNKLYFPELVLCTPNLRSVEFRNVIPCLKSASEFVCVHKVYITVDNNYFGRGRNQQKIKENLSQLLRVFHNATSFTLPPNAKQVMFKSPSLNGCSFHNLRHLEFRTNWSKEMIEEPVSSNTFSNFIDCPNLRTYRVQLETISASLSCQLSLEDKLSFQVMWNLKKKIKKTKTNREDKISHVPDCVLHEILSTLNTKFVVQTCVLSKRWKNLWTHIPTLNFHYNIYSSLLSSKNEDEESKQRYFKYFIIRVLSKHCATNIQKLTYTSSGDEDELVLVEFLICYAGSHNVQQLCINATYIGVDDHVWNYCFSTCSSLIRLKMICGFVDNWAFLALPSLKFLEIQWDWLHWDEKANYNGTTMFPGCPNLESLVFVDYLFESATISAPKLENLELCSFSDFGLTFPEVELFTPILKSVNFINVLPILKSDSEFLCIHKVNIQLEDSVFEREYSGPNKQKFNSNFGELLRVFHNARSFTLPLKATQVVLSNYFNGLSFHNIRHLRLKTNDTGILFKHLLKAPNLETFAVLNEECKDPTLSDSFY
ncbi:uncharacterized protein LOC120079853 [Benincasa hispida]|uniref:uncharacterized protein LOC120079853 n=1 Tax=Benincasa hispida TaxID=102211 RepID=UPI001900B3B2|nr:uncharacterized protein LOC120079853 [Benincasa hispida]